MSLSHRRSRQLRKSRKRKTREHPSQPVLRQTTRTLQVAGDEEYQCSDSPSSSSSDSEFVPNLEIDETVEESEERMHVDNSNRDSPKHKEYDYARASTAAIQLENEDIKEGDYGSLEDDLNVDHLDLASALKGAYMSSNTTNAQLPDKTILDDDEVLYDGNTQPAQEWRRKMVSLDEDLFTRKDYSPGTEKLICSADKEFQLFASKILHQSDPKLAYQHISFRMVYCFLDWKLCQKKDSNGRAKRGVKSRSSLVTFWCAFRLAFERTKKQKIDKFVDCRKIGNAIALLSKVHDLTSEKRENRPMTLDDLKLQLETTLRTTEKTFKLGEQRVLAVLFLLLLAPAGARPASILQLRFGDIVIALRRDPQDPINGPRRLLIRFTLKFTKRYLGPKASKSFYIPEMIYEPNFLLNPHVFLLGILFRHRAFSSDGLNNNPHILEQMRIHDDEPELRIPFKASMHNIPVFRRAEQGPYGYTMSEKPITLSQMSGWVRRVGELIGFENNTICYSLRYMAGNNLGQSVNVSEALRNLILDHAPGSDTFQKHYLSRNVCVDLWAVHMDRMPQQALLQEAISHGSSRSSRRPVQLTEEQYQSVNQHPKIVRMAENLQNFRPRTTEYDTARRELRAVKKKIARELMVTIRQEWTEKQAVEDIERQVQGVEFAPVENRRLARPMGSHQENLVHALTASLICDLPTQRQRRTAAINAIVSYCDIEEPVSTGIVATKLAPAPAEVLEENPIQSLRQSVLVKSEDERLLRCFICVGKALSLTLAPEDPKWTGYCRTFHSPHDVARHFRRQHLAKVGPSDQTKCPICPDFYMINKKHFQRHAQDVHGIWTQVDRGSK